MGTAVCGWLVGTESTHPSCAGVIPNIDRTAVSRAVFRVVNVYNEARGLTGDCKSSGYGLKGIGEMHVGEILKI
jgi:hypothetical protein